MHYHNAGYKCNNDYGLLAQVMRPVHIYLVSMTEASFNLADYKKAQNTISPFMPRQPRSLSSHGGVYWHLTFNDTPPLMPEVDSNDERYLPTADLDDQVWSEEPVPDSREYMCIHNYPGQKPYPHNPFKLRYQQPYSHNPIKWKCQQPHLHNLIKWRCPQNLNSWN